MVGYVIACNSSSHFCARVYSSGPGCAGVVRTSRIMDPVAPFPPGYFVYQQRSFYEGVLRTSTAVAAAVLGLSVPVQ